MAQYQITCSGREVYAQPEIALGQQLYINSWIDLNRTFVKFPVAIEVKATIPEETYPVDDPPNPQGTVGRAEINFSVTIEGDDMDQLNGLIYPFRDELSSNEVMGWVGVQ